MLPDDYHDFTADELSEEIKYVDRAIEDLQNTLASKRKLMNYYMGLREDLIDRQKQLMQKKGWN